jgi:cobalt-zinc-cadmium efflux system membrane fusion protein
MDSEPANTRLGRRFGGALNALVVAGGLLLLVALMAWGVVNRLAPATPHHDVAPVSLVAGSRDVLEISPEVRSALGVVTAPAKPAGSRDHLELLGSLNNDPNHMSRLRSRFSGEVVAIGPATPSASGKVGESRPLRVGDHVKEGQLLAVVWSKDLGEKKSDLVDALSQLGQHERQYKKLRSLEPGFVSEKDVLDAQRQTEADVNKVNTVVRILLSWKLKQAEIDVARVEAEKIHNREPSDVEAEQHWAEVEVRSPLDGVIMERNATLGDMVTTDADLFKIADLTTLGVLVHAFEDYLPALQALPPGRRQWTIHLKSQPGDRGTPGSFESIGKVIDPTQHTATVTGWVDNREGHLRVGQFVTASIDLPPHVGEVAIPKSALIEQGNHAVIFVATDPDVHRVECRRISVARRTRDQIFVRSEPEAHAHSDNCKPLAAGELVVTSGAVELAGALQDALSAQPPEESTSK